MLLLPPRCCALCLPPWPGMKPFNVTKLTKESWLGMAPHVLIPLQKAPQGARPNPKMSLLPQAASPMMGEQHGLCGGPALVPVGTWGTQGRQEDCAGPPL